MGEGYLNSIVHYAAAGLVSHAKLYMACETNEGMCTGPRIMQGGGGILYMACETNEGMCTEPRIMQGGGGICTQACAL